ncbi:hypothetical protein [Pedobacter sp. UBA4863]|uniref:hypothetical protein n=1 Tax=Pedobacter sp. UBA4863 TaxID=1947060 RepID=UPI0025E65D1B|nr:hypothetical protein [Pedobacter sp. UBA4863]
MKTQFELVIDGRLFRMINMNVQKIQLLQVFTEVGGKQQRFHIHSDNGKDLIFAMPEFVPADILSYERQLSEGINEFYSSPEGQS